MFQYTTQIYNRFYRHDICQKCYQCDDTKTTEKLEISRTLPIYNLSHSRSHVYGPIEWVIIILVRTLSQYIRASSAILRLSGFTAISSWKEEQFWYGQQFGMLGWKWLIGILWIIQVLSKCISVIYNYLSKSRSDLVVKSTLHCNFLCSPHTFILFLSLPLGKRVAEGTPPRKIEFFNWTKIVRKNIYITSRIYIFQLAAGDQKPFWTSKLPQILKMSKPVQLLITNHSFVRLLTDRGSPMKPRSLCKMERYLFYLIYIIFSLVFTGSSI